MRRKKVARRSGHHSTVRDVLASTSRPISSRTCHPPSLYQYLSFPHCHSTLYYYLASKMARGIEGNEITTPRATLKKQNSSQSSKSGPKQQSIAGFFQRRTGPASSTVTPAKRASNASEPVDASRAKADLTPGGSTAVPASSSPRTAPGASQQSSVVDGRDKENGKAARCHGTGARD